MLLLWLLLPYTNAQVSKENPFPNEMWNTGFIDVGGNLLFYYLFRCRNPANRLKTLTLWLEGGPGYSSTFGVFAEGGPYVVNNATKKVEYNYYAWNTITDTLFIDQPAPTNFSITEDPSKKCRNETCIARDLHVFFIKFFELYPEYKRIPMYISGVSYGGHYVPYLAHYLVNTNNDDFNVKGIAIGNGLIDEYSQLWSYPYTLYKAGLIGWLNYTIYEAQTLMCRLAYLVGIKSMEVNCTQSIFSIYMALGLKQDPYDLKETFSTYDVYEKTITEYVNKPSIQAALGVSGFFSPSNDEVYELMKFDFSLDLSSRIAELLDKGVKVFLFYGEDDYVCNMYGGESDANKIPWSGKEQFMNQSYRNWIINEVNYATYREYGNLRFIRVKNAGHTIFFKQRFFALEMLKELISVN